MKTKLLILISILITLLCTSIGYLYFNRSNISFSETISEAAAVETVKSKFSELKEYPNDKLPPKSIKTEKAETGWYVAFVQEGSGVSIIEARCFLVKNDKVIMQRKYIPQDNFLVGEFSARECKIIENAVGGEKDEHGCIGSAGYSWCQEKQKCLQVWEEPCGEGTDSCKADSDCPANYICEAIQSTATACSSIDPNCKTTFTITKGVCKLSLKAGSKCGSDQECQAGLICHAAVCINPIGRQCSDSSDTSCPNGYQCIQSCGAPVAREGNPPPPYYCELDAYAAKPRMCPICLASNAMIDTPQGLVPVKDLRVGMPIWTTDTSGQHVSGVVQKTSRVPVPPTHQMVHVVLNDGRELFASPGHPTIDGRTVGDLVVNDLYNGARVVTSERTAYDEATTYDILSSGETGFYWANGILLDSTLH